MPPEHSTGILRPPFQELGLRAALDGAANVVDRHVVEQNGLATMRQSLLQFVKRAHFDFDNLRAAPVANRVLKRRHDAAGQGDVVVLDEYAVREVEAMILSASRSARHSYQSPAVPGAVLRVSRMRALVPDTASTTYG